MGARVETRLRLPAPDQPPSAHAQQRFVGVQQPQEVLIGGGFDVAAPGARGVFLLGEAANGAVVPVLRGGRSTGGAAHSFTSVNTHPECSSPSSPLPAMSSPYGWVDAQVS